jgi:hypothetical protein
VQPDLVAQSIEQRILDNIEVAQSGDFAHWTVG